MYTLGAVLIIVAVITLLNVNRFVKRLDKLVERMRKFQQDGKHHSWIAKNVNEVTIGVKQNVDKVGEAIDAVEDSVCDSILNLLEGTEGLFDL